MAKSRLHELSEHGVSRLDRLALARDARDRRARTADAARTPSSASRRIRRSSRRRSRRATGTTSGSRRSCKTEDDPIEIFLRLAMEDVREACDLMRPVWDGGEGLDGYVSLEVDPTLAYDREQTFEQAIRFHEEIDRPNLFVKIPATEPGLGAIEDCIALGKSINVTLIFSLERYAEVAEAYVARARAARRGRRRPEQVASVASFFVSRVDTEADRRLDELGGDAAKLKGKLAIANAKLAYRH